METGDTCLSGGYIDLNGSSSASTGVSAGSGESPPTNLGSTAVFQAMGAQLSADVVKKVGAIFQWNITKGGKIVAKWSEFSSGRISVS